MTIDTDPDHPPGRGPGAARAEAGRRADEPLASLLTRLGRLAERRLQRALEPHAVTAAQYLLLRHIAERPGRSRADLARALQVTPQAVGGLAAQLGERGLITRTGYTPGVPTQYELLEPGLRVLVAAAAAVRGVDRALRGPGGPGSAAWEGALRNLAATLGA